MQIAKIKSSHFGSSQENDLRQVIREISVYSTNFIEQINITDKCITCIDNESSTYRNDNTE